MMRGLTQTITRWVVTNTDVSGFTFGSPTGLKGRWEDSHEVFSGPNNEELISKAVVALSADVNVGDYLFEGESVAADPTTLPSAMRVQGFSRQRTLSGVINERVAHL